MATQLLGLLFGLILWLPGRAQQSHLDSSSTPSRVVYTLAEQPPRFPGGINQLATYLRKNVHYPEAVPQGQTARQSVCYLHHQRAGSD